MSDYFQKIRYQVMWNRLIAVVEEQARTLMRVAFSPVVREAGDLSAAVFNKSGQMLAQAVTGTPGHVNSMARSVKHFLAEIPEETMRPGDSWVTNDPWKGTGHLFDLTVVSPAFHDGKLVAFFASTAHVADIGGNGPSVDSRDVFAEGLFIPILPLCSAGEMNALLMKLIRANSREADRLEGDIYALVASNETGVDRLQRTMTEYGLADLDELSTHILTATDRSMRDIIGRLPKGCWTNAMRIDGFGTPIDLVATLTIDDESIHIDFAGTSGISKYGINCPLCYADAYTSFGVKCIVAPQLANNDALLARIRVTSPEGTITNAPFPAPVTGRFMIGQMLPDVVFGCFAKAMPEAAPAEGTAAAWGLRLAAGPGITGGVGTPFMSHSHYSGGIGALPDVDGVSATAFPSGVKAIAIEITEALNPLVIWRKELRQDSGGAGRRRGGLGQIMEVGSRENAPFALYALFERVEFPARGRHGGHDGGAGIVRLKSGARLKAKGTQIIPSGDRLIIEMPGGGGNGDPAEREVARVEADLRNEFVSPEAARTLYKVAVRPDLSVDLDATTRLRNS
jgi:N-methylhydantoinase B